MIQSAYILTFIMALALAVGLRGYSRLPSWGRAMVGLLGYSLVSQLLNDVQFLSATASALPFLSFPIVNTVMLSFVVALTLDDQAWRGLLMRIPGIYSALYGLLKILPWLGPKLGFDESFLPGARALAYLPLVGMGLAVGFVALLAKFQNKYGSDGTRIIYRAILTYYIPGSLFWSAGVWINLNDIWWIHNCLAGVFYVQVGIALLRAAEERPVMLWYWREA